MTPPSQHESPPFPSFLPTQRTGDASGGSVLYALLGPTNTGKTHRAIERLVWYGAGMIGLPLRLLAREVYDRLCTRVGVEKVALITGEERIRPHGATFWVCTVESMPITEQVPIVVIDEVQLATHHERGHVFTDRLLNARGTRETWFLGSDTMRPIVEHLLPTAHIQTFERFSKLSYLPPKRLSTLPPRSAVIAFSTAHVYELAERLRQTRGGAAVVLGALSPKARNAQVEMFQSGEVPFLVSTDAIGMGLNLDLRNVFFATLRKFDGSQTRLLDAAEIGQIAGRAGRYTRGGHFGVTDSCAHITPMHPSIIEAVEKQVFHPVSKIYYRNSDLSFDSIDDLRQSLTKRPFSQSFILARGMPDERALDALLKEPDVTRTVDQNPTELALLWDVCRIPNYRQDSPSAHTKLLLEIWQQLTGRRQILNPDWVDRRLNRLENFDGSIDAMMQRISFIRTWAYITHRSDWISRAETWRSRVLNLEHALSDALHQRITAHFVDEIQTPNSLRPTPQNVAVEENTVTTATLPLGTIRGLTFDPNPEASHIFGVLQTRKVASRAVRPVVEAHAREILQHPPSALHISPTLQITYNTTPLAVLTQGPSLHQPNIQPLGFDIISDTLRRDLLSHLQAWLRTRLSSLLQHLQDPNLHGPAAGLIYVLESKLGVVPAHEVKTQLKHLSPKDLKTLNKKHIRRGIHYIYSNPLLKPKHLPFRLALWCAHLNIPTPNTLPTASPAPDLDWPTELAEALGYPRVGPRNIRVDTYEKVRAHLRSEIPSRHGPYPIPTTPMQWVGCNHQDWLSILTALQYRVRDNGIHAPKPKRRPRRSK